MVAPAMLLTGGRAARGLLCLALVLLLLPAPTAAQEAPWSRQEARLPEGGEGIAGAAAVDQVYLFGGLVDGNATDRVQRYDPARDRLETLDVRLPRPRSHMAAVWDGDLIHLAGGRAEDGAPASQVWSFDVSRERFLASRAQLPEKREGVAMAATPEGVFLLGGDPCSDCRVLRLAPSERTEPTNISLPALAHAGAFWDGTRIFLVGGTLEGQATDQVLEIDLDGDVRRPDVRLPRPTARAQVVYDGLHAHVLPESPEGRQDVMWRYAPRSGEAFPLSPMSATARPAALMTTAEEGVLLFGAGFGADPERRDGVLRFRTDAAWVAQPNPWCPLLGVQRCTNPVVPASLPLLPLAGLVLLLGHHAVWGWQAQGAFAGGRIDRRERDRYAALPFVALAAFLVTALLPWARFRLAGAQGEGTLWALRSAGGGPWWTVDATGAFLVALAGPLVVVGLLLGLWGGMRLSMRHRRGARWSWAGGLVLSAAWGLGVLGVHLTSDGAVLQWRPAVVVAFAALVAHGVVCALVVRKEAADETPGPVAPETARLDAADEEHASSVGDGPPEAGRRI